MTEIAIVFLILVVTILLFLSDRLALDLVGLLALLALYFTGVVTLEEALSGFSNSVVVTLAALFVVGGALFRTGVAASIGDLLTHHGGDSPGRLTAIIMILSALLSAFMSSTGTVAILIPAILGVATRTGVSARRLLMPLSAGCLIGGMLTLVGTAPNLVVQEALLDRGLEPFNFFSFTPMGLIILAIAVLYMNIFAQRAFAASTEESEGDGAMTTSELADEYDLLSHLWAMKVSESSPLAGQSLEGSRLRIDFQLNVLGYQRLDQTEQIQEAPAELIIQPGYILHLHGVEKNLERAGRSLSLERISLTGEMKDLTSQGGIAEVLLTPRSNLLGKTLRTARFQKLFKVNVVAAKRQGQLLKDVQSERLKFGDTLLVAGTYGALANLRAERFNFVVTGMPTENPDQDFRRNKAATAILLTAFMLGLMTFSDIPSVMIVLAVSAALLLTRCLSAEDAYRSISWQSLILIATMLPMAQALEKTGGVTMVAEWLDTNLGVYGPQFTLAGLFILTSVFSQFISNTATTVIVTPIALASAGQAQVAPHAYLMTVAVAASAAFATPVASPVNMLVMSPGRYRFGDFVKVGVPLQLLVLVLSIILLPMLFPL